MLLNFGKTKTMKLYTEEQVKEMFNKINAVLPKRASLLAYMVENITEYMTPIELPSDEEIEDKSFEKCKIESPYIQDVCEHYFEMGAKWMKEHILNQDK